MKTYVQRLGRALMLPVACLPAAALFLGIGYWIDPEGWGGGNVISAYLVKTGSSILDNLGLLFAVGVAIGIAKDKDGSSALAGLVGFLTITTILGSASMFLGFDAAKPPAAFEAGAIGNKNVFFGILVGCISGSLYNRFSKVELPQWLAFFSGRRSVPIITAAVMSVVSLLLLFVWPAVYGALVAFGESIMGLGAVGAGIYAFFNRLLIPTGLHHALNNVFWFNLANINDIGKFWTGEGATQATGGFHPFGTYVTGMYQAGFFPIMMFGLPAGALAIYRCARPEKKKEVGSLMLAGAVASIVTGVTEPLEFSFMFVAFPLYVIHAALTAVSVFIAASFQWIAGFNFSAGFIDWFLSLRVPQAHQPWMLLVQGVVFAFLYYFVFTFAIKKFNLMTPGREPDSLDDAAVATSPASSAGAVAEASSASPSVVMAQRLFTALGGNENITEIENCVTRLRMVVKDTGAVDLPAIKRAGVPGVNVLDSHNIQVVVGTQVQAVADAMEDIYGKPIEVNPKDVDAAAPIPVTTAPVAAAVQPAAPAQAAISDTSGSESIVAPASGTAKPVSEVSDSTFAQKILGDGFAVVPSDGTVVSPVSGTVSTVAEAKHAIGVTTASGVEVLIHVGIDTVELNGAPFALKVAQGQTVSAGDPIVEADLEALEQAGKESDVIVVFTNPDRIAGLDLNADGPVTAGSPIGTLTTK